MEQGRKSLLEAPQAVEPHVRITLFIVFMLLSAFGYVLNLKGLGMGRLSEGFSVALFLSILFLAAGAYQFGSLLVDSLVSARGGSRGEAAMLTDLLRLVTIALVLLIAASAAAPYLRAVPVSVGAFAGLIVGWALQGPISSLAAWAFIALKQPFRDGDSVRFPAMGLRGQVVHVGVLQTRLNQLNEAGQMSGRLLVIPNSVLFTQPVINETPNPLTAHTVEELAFPMAYDSDWDAAERILCESAVAAGASEPFVRSEIREGILQMRLGYIAPTADRARVAHEILKRAVAAMQASPRVDLALAYSVSQRKGLAKAGAAAEPVADVDIESIDDATHDVDLRPADPAYIEELAERIKQMGLLQPIVVQRLANGRHALIAGRFRFLACKKLGWKTISSVVKEPPATALPPE